MRLIALAILALATLLPAWAARATPIDRANAQADHFIRTTMAAQRIPGLQLAVVKDGRIVLSRSYGQANVENNIATRAQTLFPLNSATKSFTGVAVMQLVEAGQLDLQAPISRYLAALPATWHTVRVQQLLDHTSGLPDILDEHGLVGGGSELTAWNTITQRAPEAAPGERFRYNQTNYALLARIIATQSQMSYPQYLAKHQFGPAQMPLSTFGDSYDLVADSATMYSYFPRSSDDPGRAPRLSHWFYDMPEGLWAGGGILTTADEVAHWILALLRGQLLSADSRARMWTVAALNDGSDGSWAGGWPRLSPAPDLQVGGVGGARSAFIVYPDDDLAVIVLSNLVGANPQDFIGDIAAFYRMPAAARLNRAGRPSPAGSRR